MGRLIPDRDISSTLDAADQWIKSCLMAEMLWILLLFPSNVKANTKRKRIQEAFGQAGQIPNMEHAFLQDDVLKGIGSGGTGYNNYRDRELAFLIELVRNLKSRAPEARQTIFSNYDAFMD